MSATDRYLDILLGPYQRVTKFRDEGRQSVWMILNPREAATILSAKPGEVGNGPLVRLIQEKVQRTGFDPELSLNAQEMKAVRLAAARWQGGYQKELQAVLDAAKRHQ